MSVPSASSLRRWTRETPLNNVVAVEPAALDELSQLSSGGFDVSASSDAAARLPRLSALVRDVRTGLLDSGPGFAILTGHPPHASDEEAVRYVTCVSTLLGRLMPQDAQGTLVREVRHRPHIAPALQRYSDRADGGAYHTDGAEVTYPLPHYVALLCVRTARSGGEFHILSALEIHERLQRRDPSALSALYEPLHWDARDGRTSFLKPVFRRQGDRLQCSYLRRYIDAGHATAGVAMTATARSALDAIDVLLSDQSLVRSITWTSGQMILINNDCTLHGRTAFEDHEAAEARRLLLRTWIVDE